MDCWAPALLALFGLALATGCSKEPESRDAEFVAAANAYLEDLLVHSPEFATYLGDHRYDDRLSDYSAAGVAEGLAMVKRHRDAVAAIDPATLSGDNRIDRQILLDHLELAIFETEVLERHKTNTLDYNPGGAIYNLLARDFAPLDERLRNVGKRLEGIPAVLAAARENLTSPPKVFTDTAILQNQGTIALIRDGLDEFTAKASPEVTEEIAPARETAVAALEEYGEWLEQDLLPRSDGDFRIGADNFRRKLALAIETDLTPEEIVARARERVKEIHAEMYAAAKPLYAEYFPGKPESSDQAAVIRAVLGRQADEHPDNDTIVDDARRELEVVTAFVKEKQLVSVPDEPVEIIVMPEFQRGFSTAYCDSPGPLEKNAKTFYAIAPTPSDWPAERVESFFREYNDYLLKDLTVHEAVPGHYLQIAHSNEFQGPTLVRAIFYSGSFVEGWACYASEVMAEHGFSGPEYRLQQLKFLLRAVVNAILDYEIHAGSMTEDEAMKLMMEEGFQEEGEAAGKWNRARLSSTQLSSYFVGNLEINDIRRDWEAEHGPITDMKAFHDRLLSYGSPPAKYVRELMGL